MKLDYLSRIQSQDIDMDRLRPDKSYDHLIDNRNASLAALLADEVRLQEFLSPRPCPNCGENAPIHLFRKDSLDIVECADCSMVYVNPVFNEEKYIQIYRSEEYQEIVRRLGEESHEYRRNRFGTERMDAIERFHSPGLGKTLFEIGCSTGFVLEEAEARGWQATGLELNPSAVAFGVERGLDIRSVPLAEAALEEPYAAAAMYDVLEHIHDPGAMLDQVRDLLHPGGNVFIYVPNFNSASRELLGEQNAHFIWPTHHLTYFTPKTLRDFVERRGFTVLHWETQGLDLQDWIWFLEAKKGRDTSLIRENLDALQFYINGAGHGKNLRLYARRED